MTSIKSLIKKIKETFSFLTFINRLEQAPLPELGSTSLYFKPNNRLFSLDSFGNEIEYVPTNIELVGDVTGTLSNTTIEGLSLSKLVDIPNNTILGRITTGVGPIELLNLQALVDTNKLLYFSESQNNIYGVPTSQWAVNSPANNANLVLKPLGNGFIAIQNPDSTNINGLPRGDSAIDFQRYRSNHTQVAGGPLSFIGNGLGNKIISTNGFIGNGSHNFVYGEKGAILNGSFNINTGNFSTIINGTENIVASDFSTILGGVGGNSFSRENVLVFSGGSENIVGDAQFVTAIYRGISTSNTAITLTSNSEAVNSSNIYTLQPYQTANISIKVICRDNLGIGKAGFKIEAVISRNATKDSITIDWFHEVIQYKTPDFDALDIELAVNAVLGGIEIRVIGKPATEIIWVATLESVETIFVNQVETPGDNTTDFGNVFTPTELIGTGNTKLDGNPGSNTLGVAGEIVPGSAHYVGLALVYSTYTGTMDRYGNYLTTKVVIYNGALTNEDPASPEALQEVLNNPDAGCVEAIVSEPTYIKRCTWYSTTEQPHDPFSGSQFINPCPAGTFYTGYIEFPEGEYRVMCCTEDEVSPIPPEIDTASICQELVAPQTYEVSITGNGSAIVSGSVVSTPVTVCAIVTGRTNLSYVGPYFFTDVNDATPRFSGSTSGCGLLSEGSIYNGAGNLTARFNSDQGEFYVYFAHSFNRAPASITNVTIN